MLTLDKNMMRSIIMDHYDNPENKRDPEDNSYTSIHKKSDSCIDDINVYLKLNGNVIEDVCFNGIACTICTSSSDIMCDLVTGKTVDEAKVIIENYLNMIYERDYDPEILEEALAFQNTSKQAARIKCATAGWTGLKELLEKDE